MSLFRLVRNKFWVAGFLIFLNLILISLQIPSGSKQENLLERILFTLASPVQKLVAATYHFLNDEWEQFKELRTAQKENQELKKKIFFLQQEEQLLKNKLSLALKQKELEETLKLLPGLIIPARIIGFDTSNYYRSAIIDKGRKDGVNQNLPVCDKFGHLLGRTAEPITGSQARVILITSEDSGVAVITTSDKMVGILSGNGQGECLIKYVMASSPLGVEGDEVQTSGFDKIFPPGLKVGRIVSISAEKGVFKKIVVKPYFDLRELDVVAVLKTAELMR
jgi:rod shape-determining protein MreC